MSYGYSNIFVLPRCALFNSRPNELAALIHDSRTLITSIPKAKTAKISM